MDNWKCLAVQIYIESMFVVFGTRPFFREGSAEFCLHISNMPIAVSHEFDF